MSGEVRVLVAAAGRGTRAGLPYPKTLHPVGGTPILVRTLRTLAAVDRVPTVVVSPEGEGSIRQCLEAEGIGAKLVVQPEPRGMGDAVLRFRESAAFARCEHVVLVWGDVVNLNAHTVADLLAAHLAERADLCLATRHVGAAYTIVERDSSGAVLRVTETRERNDAALRPGERDIGLFVFRPQVVLPMLEAAREEGKGAATGEHGFLYVIEHLVREGRQVIGLPIAKEEELVSLNRLSDLDVSKP